MGTQRRFRLALQSASTSDYYGVHTHCCKPTIHPHSRCSEGSRRHQACMILGVGKRLHVRADSELLSIHDRWQAHMRLCSCSRGRHSQCSEDSPLRLPHTTMEVDSFVHCRSALRSHAIVACPPSRTQLCMVPTSPHNHDSPGSRRPVQVGNMTAVDTLRHGRIELQSPSTLARSPAHIG